MLSYFAASFLQRPGMHRGAWCHIGSKALAQGKSKSGGKRDIVASGKAGSDAPSPSGVAAARFPVVGVGASAGGLAALEQLFSGMPDDGACGLAFVVVQHLAPDHRSLLAQLIQRKTRMRVLEAEEGMRIAADHVYIIPPGRKLAIMDGALRLSVPGAPRGQRLLIDDFFSSLAKDQGQWSIGVILSGTGGDGSLGLRAIKDADGMAMVQSPESAEFDGMPRSAIDTGVADYICEPAAMVTQVMGYVARTHGAAALSAGSLRHGIENGLARICSVLNATMGHDFSHYKASTIGRRVERRMAIHNIKDVSGYLSILEGSKTEASALFGDLLIGVTSFFRDPRVFEALEATVIPTLLKSKAAGETVRVWCAGCSTGEEAYSIAILLAEAMERLNASLQAQVFATDIDGRAIAVARAGVYPAAIAADISDARLARFFTPAAEGGSYRFNKTIRDMLIFSEHSLAKDPPFSRLDLVLCRNVMIYMDATLQKRLFPLFHYALNPAGFLVLGTSETIGEQSSLFSSVDRKLKMYHRRDDGIGAPREGFGRLSLAEPEPLGPTRSSPSPKARKESLKSVLEQALLKQLDVVAALVNAQGAILYLLGRSGLYLEPAEGEGGNNNIVNMAREGLRHGLGAALAEAARDTTAVRRKGLQVRTNGDFTTVNLVVAPAPVKGEPPMARSQRFLVILERAPAPPAPPAGQTRPLRGHDSDPRIDALLQDLRTKDEYLQATNEELETSNEQLRSSNEEMQSINEELQSTNEEIETSKEELQSVNEELATVNSELQANLGDLARVNNDMTNLLAGTGIATVFVDNQLRILRFTPAASRIINLIASDVGRPVGHLSSTLVGYDRLVADTEAVLETLVPANIEVQTKAGVYYAMRILPYRTLDNVIEGAVITFQDITAIIAAREALALNDRHIKLCLQSSGIMAFCQDLSLKYTWVRNAPLAVFVDSPLGCLDGDFINEPFLRTLIDLKKRSLKGDVVQKHKLSESTFNNITFNEISMAPMFDTEQGIVGICGTLSFTG
jgi:two-component system CheB/CheR fusion protein